MGCNCRKAGTSKTFVWKAPDGREIVYRTEIEAKAAVVRNGGSYTAK